MAEYGDTFNQLVAGELRAERGRRKITIDALVTATGLSKSAVLNYLNGRRDIPTSALAEITRGLGVDSRLIFERAFDALDHESFMLAASDANYDEEFEAGQELP